MTDDFDNDKTASLAALSLSRAIFLGEFHGNAQAIAGCGASASQAISGGYLITSAEPGDRNPCVGPISNGLVIQ